MRRACGANRRRYLVGVSIVTGEREPVRWVKRTKTRLPSLRRGPGSGMFEFAETNSCHCNTSV